MTQFHSLRASAQVFHYLISLISVFDKKGSFKPDWAGLATITQVIRTVLARSNSWIHSHLKHLFLVFLHEILGLASHQLQTSVPPSLNELQIPCPQWVSCPVPAEEGQKWQQLCHGSFVCVPTQGPLLMPHTSFSWMSMSGTAPDPWWGVCRVSGAFPVSPWKENPQHKQGETCLD